MRPETAKLMHTSALTIIPGLHRMLLGFYEMDVNGHRAMGHGGDTVAFHSDLMLMPDDHVGVFISMNSRGKGGASNFVRAELMERFADRYFPAPAETKRVPDAEAKKHAQMMAGTYISSRGAFSNFISLVGMLGQAKVGVDGKGRLVAPVWPSPSGEPRRWVEISPFVWQDVNGHEKLAAEVKDGRVTRFSEDAFSPFMIFYRAPWYQNSALLLPLLGLSVLILALTILLWPVRWLVRRHYGSKLALEGVQKRAHLLSRLAAAAILLALVGWFAGVTIMLSNLANLSGGADAFLYALQLFGWVAFVGGFAVLAWNVWVTWRSGRRWPAKTWSIALLFAALVALWIAIAFKLLVLGVNY
jgi:hypothetical protein